MIKNIALQSKSPTALIVGKKIIPDQPVFSYDDEKPPPFQIFSKKKRIEKSPPANDMKPLRKKLNSVSNHPNRLPPKPPDKEAKKQQQKPTNSRAAKPPLNKSFQRNRQREKENIKEAERPQTSFKSVSPNIEAIIKKSLKKELKKKIKKEKEKKGLEEMKNIKKQEIQARDIQIREENSRIKQVKFNPKYNWGADQSRLEIRRKSEKDVPKRPKSSERVRTCLDTIKEIQMELGVNHFRSRSLSQKSDSEMQNKKIWSSNPEVRAFMKKQDLCRKQKKIYENLHKFAEESRRRAQLNKLQSASKTKKKQQKRAKKVKKAKIPAMKKPFKFVIKEDSLEDQKSLSLIYDSNRKSSSNLDLKIQLSKISQNSNIQKSDSEFYKSSEEEVFDAESEELKYYAASKIQALIRGYLVRKRLLKEYEFDSIDDQVKNITGGLKNDSISKKPKGLKIDLPSESSEYSYIDSQESEKSYQIQPVPNAEEELKRQVVWREAQMISLENLRKKEIRDIQNIAEKMGKADELGDVLSDMVGKRYSQISELFQQNLKEVQNRLEEDLNTDERGKLHQTLDEKREEFSRLVGEFEIESDSSSENRPVIYKPKSLEKEDAFLQQLSESDLKESDGSFIASDKIESGDSDVEISRNSPYAEMEQISFLNQGGCGKIVKDASSEDTSIDLKGSQVSAVDGPARTPDYIPARPQAPLDCFSGENKLYSPELQVVSQEFKPNCIQVDLTPELVNTLADSILFKILDSLNLPEIQNLAHLVHSPSSSSSESFHIQTDSASIRTYVEEIFNRSDINDLTERLKIPLKKKSLDVLSKMQEIEIGTMTESEYFIYPEILRVSLYIDIENNRETLTTASVGQLGIEAEHIHNKMIFDATNEAMQKYRPYGLIGAPMPWSNRKLWSNEKININKVLKEVTNEIVESSQVGAGKIGNEEGASENGADEEMLQQIREERLASMLADEIIARDEIWVNYEFEETQVKLDLADMILEFLSEETMKVLESNK